MGVSMDPVMLGPELLAEAEARADDLIAWRREFHQFPELAFEENITASRVSQTLASFPGVEVVTGFGVPTAVLGVLRGDLPGPAVALRAELDALEAVSGKGDKRLDAETLKAVREALYGG